MKIQRMDCTPKTNGNVMLVEPNCVNINNDIVNGIPQYQDMYIFAELTAQSKGRTVIVNSNVSSTKSKTINFIGNNQDNVNENNPNYLNFTTNYYDGSTGTDGTHYEGFGINSIKIVINSSFIPQVNIQFIDVRGLAFFNQQDSPYRILFDFPPPIFTLTVKGYYGKPLTYRLHLVKYTSEFSATNGNFIIDAQFVAVTFAPLTDILFRYVVNTPLINNEKSMDPKPGVKPANTFELILKLKNLYAAVAKKLKTDAENIAYQTILTDLEKIDFSFDLLKKENYKENEVLKPAGTPFLVMRNPKEKDKFVESVKYDTMTPIASLGEFNEVIKLDKSSGYESTIRNRIYLVYVVGTAIKPQDAPPLDPPLGRDYSTPDDPIEQTNVFANDDENNSTFEEPLLKFKELLINESETISSLVITDDDISPPASFSNPYNIQTSVIDTTGLTKYYGMDISILYYKLYTKASELEEERNTLSLDIARKINAMVSQRLGMTPSIYNIFKVILDDVDKFFGTLKSTSNRAYISHEKIPKNKKIILGDDGYNEKKSENTEVFAFPLVINRSLDNREERIAPIALSKKVPFPELDLVSDFMDTFLIQNRYAKLVNGKNDQDDDGEYKWIPISPIDSILGGATPENPYLGLSDDVRGDALRIMMERFYIFTQGTLPEAIYVEKSDDKKNDKENIVVSNAYVELYAEAEAINLVSALVAEQTRQTLEVMSNEYTNTKLGKFYEDISGVTFTYDDGTASGATTSGFISRFPKDDPKYFSISPTDERRVFIDKNNDDFTGLHLIDGRVEIQDPDKKKSDNPVDNFADSIKDETKGLFKKPPAESYIEFTLDNLMYVRDENNTVNNIIDASGKMSTKTRYLNPGLYRAYRATADGTTYYTNTNFPGWEDARNLTDAQRQEIAYTKGNLSFKYQSDPKGNVLNINKNINWLWGEVMGENDTELIETLTGSTQRLSSMLILSNFGYTASPFNVYPNALNNIVFNTPATIEVPQYYAPYLGMLVNAIENNWVDEIKTFFLTGPGSELDNRGFYVLADLHDVENYLSEKDKETVLNAYNTWYGPTRNMIVNGIEGLYKLVRTNEHIDLSNAFAKYYPDLKETREELYKYYLNPNAKKLKTDDKYTGSEGYYFGRVMRNLIFRTNMLNYSQITFKIPNPDETGYTSLEELNRSTEVVRGKTVRQINDAYFTKFFGTLNTLIGEKELELKEEEEELKRVKGDVDIINQLYYSFKNINDKWLTGTASGDLKYPFNSGRGALIDSFAFVDRGMNPIGETIINAEILGDMMEDPNISLFSVLTQLLSLNGFEFFPLQNFLSFNDETSWKDSFGTHTGGYDDNQNAFFVCMYIGGSASYPSVSGNGFESDGIIDISEPGVKGFSADDDKVSNFEENTNQEKNTDFPWRQVRAFRVRFGEQNQSMFTDIKIDSKEYPETNESIQILSRLAGDQNPDAPVPKGQNLYNLYENRSYKATVTGFGNAMIQPTQYFQLENIPMFNGAYIILNVEHNITANKMTTSFSGTKLLKYPMPRVLTPVAFTSYDGLGGPDAIALAQSTVATQSNFVTQTTLDRHKAGLGVDLSKANGMPDWAAAKSDNVTYAVIKITEGMSFYDGDEYDMAGSVKSAVKNGIEVGFYHLARFDRGTDPVTDGTDDANNCIARMGEYDKSRLPIALDIEEFSFGPTESESACKWTGDLNANINKFVGAFFDTLTAAGYKSILYVRTTHINEWGLNNYYHYPIWVAQWMLPSNKNKNVEVAEPATPKEWKNGWDAWQFSSGGIVKGIKGGTGGGVDINMIKHELLYT